MQTVPSCRQSALTGAVTANHQNSLNCCFAVSRKCSSLASAATAYRAHRQLWCRQAVADFQALETGVTEPVQNPQTSDVAQRQAPPHRQKHRPASRSPVRFPLAQQNQARSAGSSSDPSSRQARVGTIKQAKSKLDISLQLQDPNMCHQALHALESAAAASRSDELLSVISKQDQRFLYNLIQQTTPEANDTTDAAKLDGQMRQHPPNNSTPHGKTTHISKHAVKAVLVKHFNSLNTFGKVSAVLGTARTAVLNLLLSHCQDWGEQFLLKLPANLPCTSYQSFISSCAEHNSYKAFKIVTKVLSACSSLLMHTYCICFVPDDVAALLHAQYSSAGFTYVALLCLQLKQMALSFAYC